MAIVPLPLKFDLGYQDIYQIVAAAGLNDQACNEAAECWDMLQVWRDWVSKTFGNIVEVRHRSGTDDPPDLELVFQDDRVIAMEHTHLQSQHLGQASAFMRASGKGGFVPPIWPPPANFAEMKDIVAGAKTEDANFVHELLKSFDLLALMLRRKMRGLPKSSIIGMVHDLNIDCFNRHQLRDMAQNIVNRPEFGDFTNHTLILLDRWNHCQYRSLLIRRGQAPLVRDQLGP